MKSNYEPLGKHVRLVDTRNSGSLTDKVLGISIDKSFMPSVANVIGTDLTKYKLISKGLFACNPMHVGRDERLPVALYLDDLPAIVSPAYFMFEVVDTSVLNPEYLMLWFRRPEFDRVCWLKTDGSVRGGITWDDICRLELPVPPIEKQNEIVASYKVISNRIALKKQINDNLEEQAVCFIQNYITNQPDAWTKSTVNDLISQGLLDAPMDGNHGEIHPKSSDYVQSGVPFIMANNLINGYVDYENCAYITANQAKTLRKGFAHPGDVLLTHKATIGRTAIVSDKYPITILTPQVTYYRTHGYLYNGFLRYYFETSEFKKTLAAWSGAGSTRAYIGITKQLELPISMPNKKIMANIKTYISSIENMRYANHVEIEHLSRIKDLLVTQLSSC